jgi:hypothetical protein
MIVFRFRIRTLMVLMIFAAIALSLLAVIANIDDREKPVSYRIVAGWLIIVLVLYAIYLRRPRHHPKQSAGSEGLD